MYMWREFDIGEIRDELAQISDIGFDTVRLFALTQDFLPNPGTVASEMVARLVEVTRGRERRRPGSSAHADRAEHERSNLVAVLDAGSSGPAGRSVFGSGHPAISGAACRNLCARACRRASVRAIDVANEIDDAQRPASRDAGRLWASVLAGAIRQAAPGVPIQIGAHLPSLTTENHMRIDDLAARRRRRHDARVSAVLPDRPIVPRSRTGPVFLRAHSWTVGYRAADADAGVRAVHRAARKRRDFDHGRFSWSILGPSTSPPKRRRPRTIAP